MKRKIYFRLSFILFFWLTAAIANASPIITVDTLINVYCNGSATGRIYVTASNGVPPYSYAWSIGSTGQQISNLAAGIYSVTVTDGASATASTSITVTEKPAVTASSSSTVIPCYGGTTTVTISASGGDPPYSGLGAFTVSAGAYSYTVTDADYCMATTSITVSQNSALTVTSSGPSNIPCYGITATVTISAIGGVPPYSGVGTFTVSAGTYSFVVTDNANCTATAPIYTITQPTALTTSSAAVTHVSCFGGQNGSANVACAGGTPPYSYLWASGAFLPNITGLAAGLYSCTVTDSYGCTAMASVTITQPSALSIAVNPVNATCGSCSDGSASVLAYGATPNYTYSWIYGATTSAITNVSAGSYSVCVTDANSCSICDSATVGVGSCSANFSLTPDTIPHHYIAVNMASGTGPVTYLWSWGDGSTDTAAYPTHTYAAAGLYHICLSITDTTGCTSSYCAIDNINSPFGSVIIYVKVVPQLITEIQGTSEIPAVKIFPNPSSGLATISYLLYKPSDVKIAIFNSFGQEIKTLANSRETSGKKEILFDAEKLAAGIYFVKITVDGNSTVTKMAKMN